MFVKFNGKRPWLRILNAVEQGFETIITGQGSLEVSSQATQVFRTIVGMCTVFMIAILQSILTSAMSQVATTVSITSNNLPLSAISQHITIAVQSDQMELRGMLQRTVKDSTILPLSSVEQYLEDVWFPPMNDTLSRTIPMNIQAQTVPMADAWVLPTAQAFYYINRFSDKNLPHTVEFSPWADQVTNSLEMRAFPVSKFAPVGFLQEMNIALEQLVSAGLVADLKLQYLLPLNPKGTNQPFDLPVSDLLFWILFGVILFYYLVALSLALFKYLGRNEAKAAAPSPADAVIDEVFEEGEIPSGLIFRGNRYPALPGDLQGVIDAMVLTLETTEWRDGFLKK
jgi:hypothetical protein